MEQGNHSREEAKRYIESNIKSVYKQCLEAIEMRFGRDFEGFSSIRSKILRSGNDAIRKMKTFLDATDTGASSSEESQDV